ncbi:MAG: FAD-binding oxidoreductase [Rhodospirillales bacterium]|nr:FAD-binding oxidoreductase [Rhodospirillales bacterium]
MSPAGATADVLVVGGGILGCSAAWHLTRLCPTARIVVLERHGSVATQASSQAAALLTRARPGAVVVMPLVARTFAAMDELADELAQPLPLHRNGTLHAAGSAAAVGEQQALAATCAEHGLRAESLDLAEACRLVPWLNAAAVRSALLMPDDAFIDPYLLADAYARAARRRGARFRFGTEVTSINVEADRVTGVATAEGELHAPVVVLAAGTWANRLAAPLGAGLPMAPVRSQYWLTETDPLFPRAHPAVLLPEARAYTRPELGALLFGVREPASISVDPAALPADTSGYAFADDPDGWASLEEGAPSLRRFLPALDRVAIRRYVAGFSTYTPDSLFVIGEMPGTRGLFVASGCCGAGIAASGGFGEAVASLVAGETPPFDLAPFHPGRFGPVDPSAPAFRASCAAARSRKTAG